MIVDGQHVQVSTGMAKLLIWVSTLSLREQERLTREIDLMIRKRAAPDRIAIRA